MTDHRTTRRRLLALGAAAGSAALAGCSAFDGLTGDDSVELDGDALRDLSESDTPDPPRTLPVDIASGHLDDSEARARDLLAAVPDEFTRQQIPNGVMRERLGHARESANEYLARTAEADSPYERLSDLQYARGEARYVASAWAAIDDGLTRDDVRQQADEIRPALDAFRDRWEYVGTDPTRAVVVHAALEDEIRHAVSTLEDPTRRLDSGTALGVGELAERLERARASVGDAAHLFDRYTAGSGDQQSLRETFDSAVATLVAEVRARRRDRFGEEFDPNESVEPSSLVDGDVEGTAVGDALHALVDRVAYPRFADDSSVDTLASDLLVAHRQLTSHRALDSLVSRLDEGERFPVESVADVRQYRADAIDSLRAALGVDSHLVHHSAVRLARELHYADDRLSDLDGTVSVSAVDYWVSSYLEVAFVARAIPPAAEAVAQALRDA